LRNNDTIELDSTAGININDKIRIQDDTSSYEINYVKQILSATQIKVVNGFSRSFLLTHNVQMKVLRDSFTNTHTHQIRNNELEIIGVSEYLDRGYSFNHSHRVLSLISDVSTLLNENSSIIAAGSGSILYSSGNNGSTWVEKVNLNRFLEGSMEEINGVSSGIINNNQIVVGVTNGFLFVETDKNDDVVAIQNPL
jgi:hypothetical protein